MASCARYSGNGIPTEPPRPSPSGHTSASPQVSPQASANKPEADTALERRVLYHPNNKKYGEVPGDVEVVKIPTADGLELEAWLMEPPPGQPLLLYFHGNGGNVSGSGQQFEAFRRAGVGALAVDYRGYGNSPGDPSEQGLYLDGLATFDYAEQHSQGPPVILGRSLGGGVATYVAQERGCKALILESTFTSAKEVARHSHGSKEAALIDAFDNLSRLPDLKMPILLIHGTADTIIPSVMSEQLHKAAPGSQLWLVPNANHNTLRHTVGVDRYASRLSAFIKATR